MSSELLRRAATSMGEGRSNADYRAAWHSGVALAVSDLLRTIADHMDATNGRCICDDAAIVVARAFLGEDA